MDLFPRERRVLAPGAVHVADSGLASDRLTITLRVSLRVSGMT